MRILVLAIPIVLACSTTVLAWDPIGDLTHPDRIVRNVGREAGNVGRTIDQWRLEGQAQAGAPALEQWFIASRNTARANSSPVPLRVRQILSSLYDQNIFNRTTFKVGDNGALNLANLSIKWGDAGAVTLIDTIVFRSNDGVDSIPLWAHELKHVQQFREWGTRDFSIRYLRSWDGVENEAYGIERQVGQQIASGQLGASASTQPSFPTYPPQPVMGNFCQTAIGRFGPGAPAPIGFQCSIVTAQGVIVGQISY